jgi:molybdate transport system ATP-binding protein
MHLIAPLTVEFDASAPPPLALAKSATASLGVAIQKSRDSRSGSNFTLEAAFSIPSGITILFGPSGSGKSTVLDCIAGLVAPDSGRIVIGNRVFFDSATGVNVGIADRNVGFVFQDLGLFPHMTVEDNIQYGLVNFAQKERRRRCEEVLEAFHIGNMGRRFPGQLSGGERQRVALARALVTEPTILLLDEPLSAVDASVKARIIEDICSWNCSHRIPILYVTHDRGEVFALGERIIVLDRGKILAEGIPYEILQSPRQEAVAHLAGFENVFDAEIVTHQPAFGTMICRLGNGNIFIETPLAQFDPGTRLRLGVRAGDILLACEQPRSLSARNILSGFVVSLTRHDFIVKATVDCGVLLHVNLTLGGSQLLELKVGSAVWVVIKTYSCALLHGELEQRASA